MAKKSNIIALIFLAVVILFLVLVYSGVIHISTPNTKSFGGFIPLVVFVSALIDSINPCAFSVLFLTIAFLFSLGHGRKHIIKAGLLYILGIFLVYILIGLGVLEALTLFNVPSLIAKIGAVIVIIFGVIGLINDFFPKFPIKLKIPDAAHNRLAKLIEKATLPTAFILGVLVGMFEFPCTGGPYLFILGLLHSQSGFMSGAVYLIFYNLIFVLPLAIILALAVNNKVLETVDKMRKHSTKAAGIWFDVILIVLGMLVFVL